MDWSIGADFPELMAQGLVKKVYRFRARRCRWCNEMHVDVTNRYPSSPFGDARHMNRRGRRPTIGDARFSLAPPGRLVRRMDDPG